MSKAPRLARMWRSWAHRDAAGGMQAGPSDHRGWSRSVPALEGVTSSDNSHYQIYI